MMREGIQDKEETARTDTLQRIPLVVLSLATSIDALAVGLSFGILRTPVLVPALTIGIVCISFTGVMLGEQREERLSNKWRSSAD